MTICSSHGIKTQEIKGKLSITTFKIYHLTATSPNNIHHSPDNIIPHIKVPGINTGYLPHSPTQKIKQNHTNANYVI